MDDVPNAETNRAGSDTFVGSDRTPMYAAMHAVRYQRQALIRDVEAETRRHLNCYVSGRNLSITSDDTLGFVDPLHKIPKQSPIDLLLHTAGGDIDAAHKLIELIHARTGGNKLLRVLIPDYAKSAGTLMALGAESIVMSDSSELGMIDPQYPLKDGRGNEFWTSVVAYLDAYHEHAEALRRSPDDRPAAMMLGQFDPVIVRKFQGHRDRARDIALRMLNR